MASEASAVSLKGCSAEDLEALAETLGRWCEQYQMACSKPFLIGWYNSQRDKTANGQQRLDLPEDAVAFTLYSVPQYLQVIVEHFARVQPKDRFVDSTTNRILSALARQLPAEFDAFTMNTDEGPPFPIHVQSIGAVAGMDQHVEVSEVSEVTDEAWAAEISDELEEIRDPKMWGTNREDRRRIFPVNVHPKYGGWYSYRAVVVLRGVRRPDLLAPEPLSFLSPEEKKRILGEYNSRHHLCHWRDLSESGHPPEDRYTPDEYFFFIETNAEKRRRFLELQASRLPPETDAGRLRMWPG
mmetsp:Transcript_44177/g.99343  ORF Transcript_44177/g.99343 Transcript_44177/m.99343 type:complete len:298 (+) Transcript_44177:50-943(+)